MSRNGGARRPDLADDQECLVRQEHAGCFLFTRIHITSEDSKEHVIVKFQR
jgi:hypothetical protein